MSYDNRPTPMESESVQSGKTNRTLLWAVAGIVIVAIVAAVALSMNRSDNVAADQQAAMSAQAAQSQADAGAQAAAANANAANAQATNAAQATQAQANAQAAQADAQARDAQARQMANDNAQAPSSDSDMAPPPASSQGGAQ
jgi:hypothetical protein